MTGPAEGLAAAVHEQNARNQECRCYGWYDNQWTLVLWTLPYGSRQFLECDFNDQRLTKRMVHCADFVRSPNDSTPASNAKMDDCKAMYRLMDNDKVSFQAIIEPHCTRTRSLAQRRSFFYL